MKYILIGFLSAGFCAAASMKEAGPGRDLPPSLQVFEDAAVKAEAEPKRCPQCGYELRKGRPVSICAQSQCRFEEREARPRNKPAPASLVRDSKKSKAPLSSKLAGGMTLAGALVGGGVMIVESGDIGYMLGGVFLGSFVGSVFGAACQGIFAPPPYNDI